MEYRVLKYFLAVVREENMSRAAQVLHLTQPTLSRQIAQLEEELGAKLFERGNRAITLTHAGMLLRQRAEEIVALTEKTRQEFDDLYGQIGGTVHIGSAGSLAAQVLSEWIGSFHRRYPDIRFDILYGNGTQIRDMLDQGLVDFGLLIEPVECEKYDFIRLEGSERWGLLMRNDAALSSQASITPENLSSVSLLISRRMPMQGELANWLRADVESLPIVATYNLISGAVHLVEKGIGYAITLEGAVAAFDPLRLCFRPFEPELRACSILAWKKHQLFGAAASRFMDEIPLLEKQRNI